MSDTLKRLDDTVPPPPGEDDAYSACTVVGAVSPELLALVSAAEDGNAPVTVASPAAPPRPRPKIASVPRVSSSAEAAKPALVEPAPAKPALVEPAPAKPALVDAVEVASGDPLADAARAAFAGAATRASRAFVPPTSSSAPIAPARSMDAEPDPDASSELQASAPEGTTRSARATRTSRIVMVLLVLIVAAAVAAAMHYR